MEWWFKFETDVNGVFVSRTGSDMQASETRLQQNVNEWTNTRCTYLMYVWHFHRLNAPLAVWLCGARPLLHPPYSNIHEAEAAAAGAARTPMIHICNIHLRTHKTRPFIHDLRCASGRGVARVLPLTPTNTHRWNTKFTQWTFVTSATTFKTTIFSLKKNSHTQKLTLLDLKIVQFKRRTLYTNTQTGHGFISIFIHNYLEISKLPVKPRGNTLHTYR